MARCPYCDAEISMLGIDEDASRSSLATVHICPACEAVLGVTADDQFDPADPGVDA